MALLLHGAWTKNHIKDGPLHDSVRVAVLNVADVSWTSSLNAGEVFMADIDLATDFAIDLAEHTVEPPTLYHDLDSQ